jgi:hypothetical protein
MRPASRWRAAVSRFLEGRKGGPTRAAKTANFVLCASPALLQRAVSVAICGVAASTATDARLAVFSGVVNFALGCSL